MPDKDGWLDLMTEWSPPENQPVEVKGFQNMGGSRWEPYGSFAVLIAAGWQGEEGGDHLNLAGRYRLTHWRPRSFVLSLEEEQFVVSLLEGIELGLEQVSGRVEGVPNGEKVTLDLQRKGLVQRFPPHHHPQAAVKIFLTYEGKRRAEALKAEGVRPLSLPPTPS